MVLNSVDLFTGIGGFVLGLEGICSPILYCDNEPAVLQQLHKQMADGRLPKAPVVDDVRKLRDIVAAVGKRRVDVVTAGFPCVGFSSSGNREGLDNVHSALFRDTVKVVRALKPKITLFENVPPILFSNEGEDIAEIWRTMRAAGYACRWTMCSAEEVGAPQVRRRWFCMCTRNDVDDLPEIDVTWRNAYSRARPAHLADGSVSAKRFKMLGNTIVPSAARLAFYRLYSAFALRTMADVKGAAGSKLRYTKLLYGRPSLEPEAHCEVVGNGFVSVDIPPPPPVDAGIVLSPDNYITKSPGRGKLEVESVRITKPIAATHWPTPRAQCYGYSNYLTERDRRDLGTFALFASKIGGKRVRKSRQGQTVSIHFVEWLMGYPRDHTK